MIKYSQAQVQIAATVIAVFLGSPDIFPKVLQEQDRDHHLHFLVKVFAAPARPSAGMLQELQRSFATVAANPPRSYKLTAIRRATLRRHYLANPSVIWASQRVKNLILRLETVDPKLLASWCYSSTIPSLSVNGDEGVAKAGKTSIEQNIRAIADQGYRATISSWIAGVEIPTATKAFQRSGSEVAVSDYLSGMWSSSDVSDDGASTKSEHTVVPKSRDSVIARSQGSSATSYSASVHTGISTEYAREEAVHTRLLRQGSAAMTGNSSSMVNSDIVHATENVPHDDETSHADFDSFGFSDTEDSSKVQSLEEENRTLRRTLFKSRKALKRTWDGRMALERHLAYEYRRGGIHRVVLDQIARNLGRAPFGSKHSRRRIRLSRLA